MKLAVRLGVLLLALGIALAIGCWADAQRRDLSGLDRRMPARTALMLQREREARAAGKTFRLDHRPVPYTRIAPVLRQAVLVAEDDAFFQHAGLDWNQIRASAKRNWEERRLARGGSTVTQQLAKNLFLGASRTPTRKLTEVFLAGRLERALTKRRIFELYLNLIEWGDGVYGIDAAAERNFGIPAAALGPREAVLLAAVIINPRRFSAREPSKRIERRARMIAGRLHRRGLLSEAEYRIAIGEPPLPKGLDSLLAAPDTPPEFLPFPAESLVAAPDTSLAP